MEGDVQRLLSTIIHVFIFQYEILSQQGSIHLMVITKRFPQVNETYWLLK